MTITLIIKGNKEQALAAANKREIKATFLSSDDTQSTYSADPQDMNKVLKWFCEPGELIPGKGYPVGTLLLYQDRR